jgi:K+-transporting ATPase KdpF subunit
MISLDKTLMTSCAILLRFKKKTHPMKTKVANSFLILTATPATSGVAVSNGSVSYLIGGIIALLIMGYLVYTLIRPDKF